MTKIESQALLDELSTLHWQLIGLHCRVTRGVYRHLIAEADHAVCTILNDVLEQQPELTLVTTERDHEARD